MDRAALAVAIVLATGLLFTRDGLVPRGALDTSPVVPAALLDLDRDRPVATRPGLPPFPDGYRIRIPRLAIDLPIAEGVAQRDVIEQRTPEGFAFHLPGTASPGAGSNTYLYAHAREGMFLSLWDARIGEEVIVVAPNGQELRYVMTEIHPRVPPSDTSVVGPTLTERLTLQTSTGPFPDDPRFVAIAVPVSER